MYRPRKIFKNQKIRKDYYNYFDICTMEGIPTNKAKNSVNKLGVEGIKYIKELEPIEHLFVVFEKPIKGRIVNSYGILRRYYDDWKLTGEVPSPPPGRPIKEGFIWWKVKVPEHLKDEFQTIVDNANAQSIIHVSYGDMVAVALREWIDRRYHLLPDKKDK